MNKHMALLGTLTVALLASVELGWTPTAGASCVEPTPALVWSYPADGAENVPINAHLWVVASAHAESVTLTGASLASKEWSFGAQELVPDAALDPNTDYTLTLTVGSESPETFEVRFRTGESEAEPPAAPSVPGVTTHPVDSEQACMDVVETQDCFDTGQDTFVRFEAIVAGAIGYTLAPDDGYLGAGTVWPDECGAATVLTWGVQRGQSQCYEVRAIGMGGLVSEAVRSCPSEVEESPPDAQGGEAADAGGAEAIDGGGAEAIDGGGEAADLPANAEDTSVSAPGSDGCNAAPGRSPFGALLALLAWMVLGRVVRPAARRFV